MNLKFCANLSFMFQEEPNLLKRYHLAKKFGFIAVECSFPYTYPVEDIKKAKEAENLQHVLLNTYPGDDFFGELGFAAVLGKEKEFQNSVNLALLYAKALNCNKIHIMSGIVQEPTSENDRIYEANLKYVSKIFEQEKIIGLIEPINNNTVPNYYMNSYEKAVNVINHVKSPSLRLQMDIFHLQQIKGNLTENLSKYMPYVGHIQIAQVPDRNEPDVPGEIDYKYIFSILNKLGYTDWIGLEYKPSIDTISSLKWLQSTSYFIYR